jgi:hypothetical protein
MSKIKRPHFTEVIMLMLVQRVGKSLHLIRDEIARWRKILEDPYLEYLLRR